MFRSRLIKGMINSFSTAFETLIQSSQVWSPKMSPTASYKAFQMPVRSICKPLTYDRWQIARLHRLAESKKHDFANTCLKACSVPRGSPCVIPFGWKAHYASFHVCELSCDACLHWPLLHWIPWLTSLPWSYQTEMPFEGLLRHSKAKGKGL